MSRKILVVDDDQDSLEILQKILQKEGYLVKAAATAHDCMVELEADKPELLLLDVMLPDKLGTDLCLEIKRKKKYEDLIVILLSGIRVKTEDRLLGYEIGATDYINRPFNLQELVAKVDAIFRLKNAFVQPRGEEPYSGLIENNTSVTAQVFEQAGLWELYPQEYVRLKKTYLNLMKMQIETRMFKTSNSLSSEIRQMAMEFGMLNAGPRDIIQVHGSVLTQLGKSSSAVKSYYLKEESRILLVEILGYVLMYYKNRT